MVNERVDVSSYFTHFSFPIFPQCTWILYIDCDFNWRKIKGFKLKEDSSLEIL